MIIQIRGTSGAGKSTVMKQVMEEMGGFKPMYIKGRKMPLYYLRQDVDELVPMVVLSHYESPCAGLDVLGSARIAYELITLIDKKYLILCEGLMLSEDTKWTLQLSKDGYSQHLYYLTTPIERCIKRIKKRRAEKGNTKPLDEGNTRRRYEVINRCYTKLKGTSRVKQIRTKQITCSSKIVKLLKTEISF